MNIWLKTSGNRSSSRFNTSLPTIREQRNQYEDPEEDNQSETLEGDLFNPGPENFRISRPKNTLTSSSNDYGRMGVTKHSQIPRHAECNRKSVRFSVDINESQLKSKRPYELAEDYQEDTFSQVPTHYIFDDDERLRFQHIKKDPHNSSKNRQDTSNPKIEEDNGSSFTFEAKESSNFSHNSNTKSINHSIKQSGSNIKRQTSNSRPPNSSLMNTGSMCSKIPQPSSRRPQFQRNQGLMTSTSRSSMAVHYSQSHEEDWSKLRSKREVSAGKTTGRKNIKEHIISIIQYCSNEVGLAIYNTTNGEIYLCQIIERLTYFRTISTLQRFYPIEIIYSSSLQHTPLIKQLLFKFRNIVFKNYKRMVFDETKGYNIYSQRGNKDDYNPDNKFIAYSALNALIFYLQNNYETKFNYNSLSIKWHIIEDLLIIQAQTISELQIFINAETKDKNNCFVDNFNCLTYGGTRMLRANLLQPLANVQAIKERQDLVELLLENKELYDILIKEVEKFKNFEIITAKFIQSPKQKNMKSLKSFIFSIYTLSRLCLLLKKFYQKIEPYKEKSPPLLSKLFGLLNDSRIVELKEFIDENFDDQVLKNFDNSRPTKKQNFIFLFKAEKIQDDFIQVLRITYSHTTEDILRIFKRIKQKSNLDLKLLSSDFRGYYIKSNKKINLSMLSEQIQDDIIQITEKKDAIMFSTTILLSLNNRLKESQKKLILLCENLLKNIIFEIQKHIDVLFELNFQLSVLDMVLAFVSFVKQYHGVKFTKPVLQVQGKSMVVEELKAIWTNESKCRLSNPINLRITSQQKAVVIQKQSNSIDQLSLLYSIGYLTILTQIGCFVPAAKFTTDLYQTVLSKINLNQNIESNLSHFQTELYHFKSIIDNSSHHSNNCLILLDELIKGTQYEEEISLSQALLTHLIKIKGKTFVLVSDKFQLNLIIKISCIPSLINSSSYEQTDEDILKLVRLKRVDARSSINKERNPIHFELTNTQQPLQKVLKQMNFAPQFVSRFQSLLFQDQESNRLFD